MMSRLGPSYSDYWTITFIWNYLRFWVSYTCMICLQVHVFSTYWVIFSTVTRRPRRKLNESLFLHSIHLMIRGNVSHQTSGDLTIQAYKTSSSIYLTHFQPSDILYHLGSVFCILLSWFHIRSVTPSAAVYNIQSLIQKVTVVLVAIWATTPPIECDHYVSFVVIGRYCIRSCLFLLGGFRLLWPPPPSFFHSLTTSIVVFRWSTHLE